MISERCRSCLKPPFRVYSDCDRERAKIFIQLVFKFFHGFVDVMFGDKWVGVCSIPHSLDFLRNDFSYGGLRYPYRRLIGIQAVDATTMRDEIDAAP